MNKINNKSNSKKKFERSTFGFAAFALVVMLVMNVLNYREHRDFTLFALLLAITIFIMVLLIVVYVIVNRKGQSGSLGVIINTNVGLKEMILMLFHSKECPNCGGKLKQTQIVKSVKEGISKIGQDYIHGKVYDMQVCYQCESCKNTFTVRDLTK